MLGDVVFIENPAVGRKLKQGEECGVIESVKAAADIYAPIAGEVIASNTELNDAPEQVNKDPYGAWMFRLKPEDPSQVATLLDAATYRKIAESEKR